MDYGLSLRAAAAINQINGSIQPVRLFPICIHRISTLRSCTRAFNLLSSVIGSPWGVDLVWIGYMPADIPAI